MNVLCPDGENLGKKSNGRRESQLSFWTLKVSEGQTSKDIIINRGIQKVSICLRHKFEELII